LEAEGSEGERGGGLGKVWWIDLQDHHFKTESSPKFYTIYLTTPKMVICKSQKYSPLISKIFKNQKSN